MQGYQKTKRWRILQGSLALGLAALSLVGCVSTDKPSAIDARRPPTPQTLYAMARVMKDRGEPAKAIALYSQLAEDNPAFAPAYNELAELLMAQQQYDKACLVLTKGLENRPGDPVMLNNLGLAHLHARQWGAATQAFQQAVNVRPGETRYRANLALALGMQGKNDEAIALYQKIFSNEQVQRQMEAIRMARRDAESTTTTTSPNAAPKSSNAGVANPRPALPGG